MMSRAFASVAVLIATAAIAQPAVTVDALRAQLFGVGEGFGSAAVAQIRKLPAAASEPRTAVVMFHGVKVTALRTSTEVIPLLVEAASPQAVHVVSKTLSEMTRAAVVPNFGTPESESADTVTLSGPAEICAEYLDLQFRENVIVSAKWRFCVD